MIFHSWAISAVFSNILEAEQYFSAESLTARSTTGRFQAVALEGVDELHLGEDLGVFAGALAVQFDLATPVTFSRAFSRIMTTSKAVQPPRPSSSISMGRTPMLRPPASGAPSITTAWPEPGLAQEGAAVDPGDFGFHAGLLPPPRLVRAQIVGRRGRWSKPFPVIALPAMATVHFTSNLRRHVDCPRVESTGRHGEGRARRGLREPIRNLRHYILDDQGALRKHMRILIDGQAIADRHHLSDIVKPTSQVWVMQALSGG
jgi:molybdopterin synthase sulfur carrier subunit